MTDKYVITPDGKKIVAGLLHAPLAYYIDLIFAFSVILSPFAILGHYTENVFFVGILMLIIVGYAYFSHYIGISLGWWAIGLNCYNFDALDEYQGKGYLYVCDQLPDKEHTKRAIITASIFSVVFLTIYFI